MYQSLIMSFQFLLICLVLAMNVGFSRTEGNMREILSLISLESLFNKYIKTSTMTIALEEMNVD